ncbi:SDR family NAD(P)-dependent oxidoreductase [Herbiconiux sp. P17]|uniref:SDR family NAD(P)-dependent oxidoreductase n=1 Tax=Herbiconiux wuyangfengii TaxID=3342794 RepID=UPI0035BB8405
MTGMSAPERVLDGLAVVVTGGAQGLGRAYARAAAAAGARVVIGDIDAERAADVVASIRGYGGEALAVLGPVQEPSTGDSLVAACISAFGRIDGLVNNAGVLRPAHPLAQTAGDVDDTLAVNVAGVVHCGHAAMRAMVAAGAGSIVNIVSGSMQGLHDTALYGGSKGAVMSLTYGWALELAGTGVRVNAVSPLAHTRMSDAMDIPDEYKGTTPDRIAPAVVHLLSPRSVGMTGQILRFDGDRLGLVVPPHVAAVVESPRWDAASIAAAMAGPLADQVAPVGLAAAFEPARRPLDA